MNKEDTPLEKLKILIHEASANKVPKTQDEIAQALHESNIKDSTQIRYLRKILAAIVIIIAVSHLIVLYVFLDITGNYNIKLAKQFMSDKVMIAFLGTTTADVFGLLYILVRYVFPYKNQ